MITSLYLSLDGTEFMHQQNQCTKKMALPEDFSLLTPRGWRHTAEVLSFSTYRKNPLQQGGRSCLQKCHCQLLLTHNMAKRAEKTTFHQAPPFKGSYIQKQITKPYLCLSLKDEQSYPNLCTSGRYLNLMLKRFLPAIPYSLNREVEGKGGMGVIQDFSSRQRRGEVLQPCWTYTAMKTTVGSLLNIQTYHSTNITVYPQHLQKASPKLIIMQLINNITTSICIRGRLTLSHLSPKQPG